MGAKTRARIPSPEGPDRARWQTDDQEAFLKEWELADQEEPQDQGAHAFLCFYGRAVWAWFFFWVLIGPIISAYSSVRSALNRGLQSGSEKAVESVSYIERVQQAVGHLGVDRTWALVFLAVVPILGYVLLRMMVAALRWIAQGSSSLEAAEPTRKSGAGLALPEGALTSLEFAWRPGGGSSSLFPADPQSHLTARGEFGCVLAQGRPRVLSH